MITIRTRYLQEPPGGMPCAEGNAGIRP